MSKFILSFNLSTCYASGSTYQPLCHLHRFPVGSSGGARLAAVCELRLFSRSACVANGVNVPPPAAQKFAKLFTKPATSVRRKESQGNLGTQLLSPPPVANPASANATGCISSSPAVRGPSEHVVLLSSLPFRCAESDVRGFLTGCGRVVAVHFTYLSNGRASGMAYVELADADCVERALQCHEKVFRERTVRVMKSSRADMEKYVKTCGKDVLFTVKEPFLQVWGIQHHHTVDDLKAYFEGFDLANDAIAIRTSWRGENIGSAYIRFHCLEDAARAFNFHKSKARSSGGSPFSVIASSEKRYNVCVLTNEQAAATAPDPNRAVKEVGRNREEISKLLNVMGATTGKVAGHVVKLSGLPWKATDKDLRRFLSECESKIVGVHFTYLISGMPSGYAYVELADGEALETALKQCGKMLRMRNINVIESCREDMEAYVKTRGATALFSVREPVLLVSGLSAEHKEEDLRKQFSGFSVPTDGVLIRKNRKGENIGTALMRFKSVEDAQRALNENKAASGRKFTVVAATEELFADAVRRNSGATAGSPQLHPAFVVQEPFLEVRGLAPQQTEKELEQLFHGFNVVSDGIVLRRNFEGSLGYAIVEFRSVDYAEKALNALVQSFGMRQLFLAASTEADMMQLVRDNNLDLSVGKPKKYGVGPAPKAPDQSIATGNVQNRTPSSSTRNQSNATGNMQNRTPYSSVRTTNSWQSRRR